MRALSVAQISSFAIQVIYNESIQTVSVHNRIIQNLNSMCMQWIPGLLPPPLPPINRPGDKASTSCDSRLILSTCSDTTLYEVLTMYTDNYLYAWHNVHVHNLYNVHVHYTWCYNSYLPVYFVALAIKAKVNKSCTPKTQTDLFFSNAIIAVSDRKSCTMWPSLSWSLVVLPSCCISWKTSGACFCNLLIRLNEESKRFPWYWDHKTLDALHPV